MKPLPEVAPGILVIQIQIQAACYVLTLVGHEILELQKY